MQQTPTQIREHVREFVALADFSMRVDKLGNLPERFKIVNDMFPNGGALHLYDNGATVGHFSAMHLGERHRCEWFSVEVLIEFRQSAAHCRRNDSLDFLIWNGFNMILK